MTITRAAGLAHFLGTGS